MTNPISSPVITATGSIDHRDKTARGIIRDLTSLDISLKGKNIIDVGCRSGENMLAMQAEGATVIGIDPDDSNFNIALSKGARVDQLYKKTLQEFSDVFPDKKFDIATLFLWNIHIGEYDAVGDCLKGILKPGGCVIVGYHEHFYRRNIREIDDETMVEECVEELDRKYCVPELLDKFFGSCSEHPFPNSLNRYVCIASKYSSW